ncbi:phage tail tape measure C-terminal domain-containing protein [Candidatus Halocynthiibacter alkanivorans]|uniref:phage tail tape measure C-terminal domain-containing protein n=1 Tax=Candidatus Halocynthiibacter alkanivorans TaxID=2267619 RepID=UPI001359C71B|nr:phage tail tape measure C-terminal domain-containing protein [Candidatus Halocynthiibacter alkanivorans]
MAENDFERLNIILAARDRDFAKAMDRNVRRIERFAKRGQKDLSKVTRKFDLMGTAAKSLGLILAGVFTLNGIQNAVDQATEMAVELENLSRLAGVSVETFQELTYAAGKFGIGQDKIADILKDVNDKVGDFMATGGGPLQDFFENIAPKVGITASAFAKLSGPEALQAYVNGLEQAGVSQAQMTFYMEALANDATMLTPLFASNGAEMRRLASDAQELGMVLDSDIIERSAEMRRRWDDIMGKMRASFNGLIFDVVMGLDDVFGISQNAQFNKLAEQYDEQARELQNLEDKRARLKDMSITPWLPEDTRSNIDTDLRRQVADQHALMNMTTAQMDEVERVLTAQARLRDKYTNPTTSGGGGGGSKSETDALEKIIQAYEALTASLDPAAAATQKYAQAREAVNAALEAGVISEEEAGQTLSLAKERYDAVTDSALDLAGVMGTVKSSTEEAFTSIFDNTKTGKEKFADFANSIISELMQVLVVQRMVGDFASKTSAGNGILGAIGKVFDITRAGGGSGRAGQPMLINEATPNSEIYVPSQNGAVLNVAQAQSALRSSVAGGSSSLSMPQTFYISVDGGSNNPERIVAALRGPMRDEIQSALARWNRVRK